jgi:hypothetical protein
LGTGIGCSGCGVVGIYSELGSIIIRSAGAVTNSGCGIAVARASTKIQNVGCESAARRVASPSLL